MFLALSVIFLGLMIAVLSVWGIFGIVHMILTGAIAGNWYLLIGGGLMAYLFITLLCGGVIVGLVLVIVGGSDL